MNTNNGALYFGAGIDRTQWRRDIDAMRRDILGLSQTTVQESRNMNSAFSSAFAGLAGYFSVTAIRGFVNELINIRGEFQKTEIAFTTMLGSGAKAAELMSQMVNLAAKTPFGLQEVSAGAKQLLAFQIPANQVVDILTRMGNIAAGLGVPLSRINLVYGQVKAKGKLMGDDLRQFTEAGIPMIAELAAKFGKTESEITKMVSAGKIGFKDVQDVLFNLTNEGGMFYNLMEKQSASVSGQIANLGDAWDQMLNKIGEGSEGLIYSGIAGLTALVENYEEVIKVLQVLIVTYGTYRAALIVTNSLQAGAVTPAVIQGFRNLINLIRGATVAQTALNAATIANPYILLATAIAGLVAVVIIYRKEIDGLLHDYSALAQQIKYNENVQEKYSSTFSKGIVDNREKIVSLIAVINNENSKLEDRKRAYENLIKVDEAFRGALDEQYRATYKLGSAFDYVIEKMQRFALVQAEMAVKSEYLKQNAEDEFNLSIAKVKYAEAERQAKKYGDLLRQGKITIKQYSEFMKPYEDVAANLIKSQKAVNASRKDVDYVNKAEKEKLETLSKQAIILNAQIRGGKIQGKIISEEQKAILIRQLKDVKDEMRLRMGEVMEEIAKTDPKKIGWAQQIKDQIDALEAEADSAETEAGYLRIQEKIKKLREKLNPKKEKKDNRQLAEFLPIGSPEQLQQQISLLDKAMALVDKGMVKIRKLDKYGNDKDKNGNPYLTGEIISLEEAGKRREKLDAKLRETQYKNFQETLEETKRQIEVRDKLLKSGYSKETVDGMFPKVKDKTFLQFLNESGIALEKLNNKESAENLIKLQSILSEYTGEETFIENVNKQIDDLKLKFKGDELINKLEQFKKASFTGTEGTDGITGDEKNAKNIAITKAINDELTRQKEAYQNLLNEHKAFSDRKIAIEKDTAKAIEKINSDAKLTEQQKKVYSNSINKKSKEEISQLAVEELTNSKAWMALYGNIENLTSYQMQILLDELESKRPELSKVLTTVDFKILLRNFREVKERILEENPFLTLIDSVQVLFTAFGQQSKEAGENAFNGFERATDGIKGTLKATKGIISTLAPAREYMSDAANDAIDTIEQVTTMGIVMMQAIDGTVKAVKAALDKASWSNWITAIISIIYTVIKAIVSLFSWIAGNKTKKLNSEIKALQRTIDDLKASYEELQKVIEKTAGENHLRRQRELVANLQEQQRILTDIRSKESQKKKADQDKISSYTKEINDINLQIQQIVDDFFVSVTTTDFKDLATSLAEALVEGFGKGEDAAKSFEKVVDDVMKNAVVNALKIKLLQPVAEEFVNKLYSSMGFGGGATVEQENQLKKYQDELSEIEKKIPLANSVNSIILQNTKNQLLEKIKQLKAEIASNAMSGAFDGLTPEEVQALKEDYKNDPRIKAFLEGIKNIDELFDKTIEGAQGLKGDIKGITEKTAGALEGQINAMRIMQTEALKRQKDSMDILRNQLLTQVQIEQNTRPLKGIYDEIKSMNSKIKNGLAGIP